MFKRFLLIVFSLTFALSLSCNQYVSDNSTDAFVDDGIIRAEGTVKFIELEGGFFGIIADDGSKYNPINLSKAFQKDGLRIRFEGRIDTDVMSIQMWGSIFNITKIEKL